MIDFAIIGLAMVVVAVKMQNCSTVLHDGDNKKYVCTENSNNYELKYYLYTSMPLFKTAT